MGLKKAEVRDTVAEEFQRLVIGPQKGEDEFIQGRISLAYVAGMLFPQGGKRSDLRSEGEEFTEEDQSRSTRGDDEFSGDSDNPLSMANEELPSSVGISFVVPYGAQFDVHTKAGVYLKSKDEDGAVGYQRHQLIEESTSSRNLLGQKPVSVLDGRAQLSCIDRNSSMAEGGTVITISLVNSQMAVGNSNRGKSENSVRRADSDKWLFQVGLRVTCKSGFLPYESMNSYYTDIEDQILALQYSDTPTFGVGHGASVDWGTADGNQAVTAISICYTPNEYVYRPIFDRLVLEDGTELSVPSLFSVSDLAFATDDDRARIIRNAREFIAFYTKWISEQESLDSMGFDNAKELLLEKMASCTRRMLEGCSVLEGDIKCWRAFILANRAMLLQIEQISRNKELRRERETSGATWPIDWSEQIETYNGEEALFPHARNIAWRPFQLAFFLLTVAGLENPEADDHEIVDLVWFSTGGGKTEAYLLLASYELIRRRMRSQQDKNNPGTGVITRYTLRFLTADQLARTASLMCALEKVRAHCEIDLGNTPFRVGLYIGVERNSYSKRADAEGDLNSLEADTGAPHKFQITECPSCGTGLLPETSLEQGGPPESYGIRRSSDGRISYCCPNKSCLFGQGYEIPVSVIDQDIYDSPPDFLLGTVDKFAGIPWKQQSGKLFGFRDSGGNVAPPSLIIQDELHLISGPLGTVASVYEACFDTLIRTANESRGQPPLGPKYVAASATVRDSQKQIQRLMGRPAAIFPPRGLRAHDSFFAKEDSSRDTARKYIGLMPQGIRATTAAHWVSAALLQSVRLVADNVCESRERTDFLWTLLCYCNSKRELGLINGAVSQEISERMKVYAQRQGYDLDKLSVLTKQEVSSDAVTNVSATRASLLVGVTDDSSRQGNVVDFVPCTNMISVGVDIDRLGLMMVNGQPKTTAEYIQATSRVGRSPKDQGPGLVLALYSPAKPRDRSHYEHFKLYHSSLYRLVEPTSVTPGSQQALNRAAHAALVAVVRHGVVGMADNSSAGRFSSTLPAIAMVIDRLKSRMLACYEDSDTYERAMIAAALQNLSSEWENWTSCNHDLYYSSYDKGHRRLLRRYDSKISNKVGWATMQSMRGVDAEIEGRIR